MAILTFRNASLSYGQPPLLDGVSFGIERGERLCLVGRNGAGKSTLLRMIAGEVAPDDGEVVRAQGLKIAQLAQEVPQEASGSVHHVVAGGLGELGKLVERYHALTHALAGGDAARLRELEQCQHDLEVAGGWALSQRVDTVLSRLALDADTPVEKLSGGLKRRVMLARALVSEPDLLLLDEPTNHLDIAAITWLEQFLLGWNGTLLFITHDRAFLHRLATRILELDRGHLADFPGDYATYLRRKEEMLAAEEKHNALFDKKLAEEEVWVRQGIKARRTRNEGRVRALLRMREERAARRQRAGKAQIVVQEAERSSKIVIEAEEIGFDYAAKTVVRGFTATIQRGDKIGIIGPNGVGKTTLLRLLLGELEPTCGRVQRAANLLVAYFDQYRAALNEEQTVVDNVGEGSNFVTINGERRHALGYLQDFLFTPDRARQPVRALSGGERNRLLLAKLFARPSNVLVLDEPTNDLDADTLDLLEERLIEYAGTVLLVSHDRAFLNNVVTSTFVFEGNGVVNEYVGGYDEAAAASSLTRGARRNPAGDWQRQRKPAPAEPAPEPARAAPLPLKERERERTRKLSYKEQRELEELPQRIEGFERERDMLLAVMSAPGFYQQDKGTIAAAQKRLATLESSVQGAYTRWEALEALRG